MNVVIVFSHPSHSSYNYAVLQRVSKAFQETKHTIDVIDLIKDKFDPIAREADLLYAWNKGPCGDPMVKDYQDRIMKADYLVFIFPIWCWSLPAILKGFADKVFTNGWAWKGSGFDARGKLTHLKGALVVATFAAPSFVNRFVYGNPVYKEFIKGGLHVYGIKPVTWIGIHCMHSKSMTRAKKEAKLDQVYSWVRKFGKKHFTIRE